MATLRSTARLAPITRAAALACATALGLGAAGACAQDYGVLDTPALETVRLVARPAAVLRGEAAWDEAFPALGAAGAALAGAVAQAGLAPAGAPLAAFEEADDRGFSYALHLPLARAPEPEEADAALAALPALVFGATPAGYALRSSYEGAYAEIDSAYDELTAHLDREGLIVDDLYLEELDFLGESPDDPASRVGILVFPN